MHSERIIFAFFILLALTLNFGFFVGDMSNPNHHNVFELFAAVVVSLIATVLKFGDKSHVGTMLLASSLVASSIVPTWSGEFRYMAWSRS